MKSRGLNRSAVGKTQVSFTSRRPQQLVPSTLTSLLACTNALPPCYSSAWLRLAAASVRFFTSRSPCTLPRTRPLPIYSIYLKAKAVPVAASSSEIASARPTGPEFRPHSFTALRIQTFFKFRVPKSAFRNRQSGIEWNASSARSCNSSATNGPDPAATIAAHGKTLHPAA